MPRRKSEPREAAQHDTAAAGPEAGSSQAHLSSSAASSSAMQRPAEGARVGGGERPPLEGVVRPGGLQVEGRVPWLGGLHARKSAPIHMTQAAGEQCSASTSRRRRRGGKKRAQSGAASQPATAAAEAAAATAPADAVSAQPLSKEKTVLLLRMLTCWCCLEAAPCAPRCFDTPAALMQHALAKHSKDKTSTSMPACDPFWRMCLVCDKDFSAPQWRNKHVVEAHMPRGFPAAAAPGAAGTAHAAGAAGPATEVALGAAGAAQAVGAAGPATEVGLGEAGTAHAASAGAAAAGPGAAAAGTAGTAGAAAPEPATAEPAMMDAGETEEKVPAGERFAPEGGCADILDMANCYGCQDRVGYPEFESPFDLRSHLRSQGCCPEQLAWLEALRRCPDCARQFVHGNALLSHVGKHLVELGELVNDFDSWVLGSDFCTDDDYDDYYDESDDELGLGGGPREHRRLGMCSTHSVAGVGTLPTAAATAAAAAASADGGAGGGGGGEEEDSEDGELAQRMRNCGFTDSDAWELACQGVKFYDDDAWEVMNALNDYSD